MKTMADSLLSKGARTKTAPEKELAKNRSKVVRRVLYLLKLLKELFEHTLLDTEIPSPPPSPQSPIDSIPSHAPQGDSQLFTEIVPTVASEDDDGEISDRDLNRFANLILESNQSNGGGERCMQALHLLDTILPHIGGVCGVFNDIDAPTTAYLISNGHPSIQLTFSINRDVAFDFLVLILQPDLQIIILTYCKDNDVPSMLYLPTTILDSYPINVTDSRLFIYLTDSSAWFIFNFYIDLFGEGGMFKLAVIH